MQNGWGLPTAPQGAAGLPTAPALCEAQEYDLGSSRTFQEYDRTFQEYDRTFQKCELNLALPKSYAKPYEKLSDFVPRFSGLVGHSPIFANLLYYLGCLSHYFTRYFKIAE